MIWDGLYTLSVRDLAAGPAIRRARFTGSTSAAAATVTVAVQLNLAADVVFWLQQVWVNALPGAAQNFLSAAVEPFEATSSVFDRVAAFYNTRLAAAESYVESKSIQPYPLFSGESMQGRFFFSAAAAANAVELSLSGLIIPRGNLQR